MCSVTSTFKGFCKGFHRFQDDFIQNSLFQKPYFSKHLHWLLNTHWIFYRINLTSSSDSARIRFLVQTVFFFFFFFFFARNCIRAKSVGEARVNLVRLALFRELVPLKLLLKAKSKVN